MRVLAFANQKGGATKTSTTVSLAYALAKMGRRVLVIDADPQATATRWLLKVDLGELEQEKRLLNLMTTDVLSDNFDEDEYQAHIEAAIESFSSEEGLALDVIPSSRWLSTVDAHLASAMVGREDRMSDVIGWLPENRWDDVLIDCPPNLGLLSVNAIVAADEVLIPCSVDPLSLEGVAEMAKFLRMMGRRNASKTPDVIGILATRYQKGTKIGDHVLQTLTQGFRHLVFDTIVHEAVVMKESSGVRLPIGLFDKGCRAAKEYRKAAKELLTKREQAHHRRVNA